MSVEAINIQEEFFNCSRELDNVIKIVTRAIQEFQTNPEMNDDTDHINNLKCH